MRVLFVVNDLASFLPGQTTALLVRAALAREHRVWVAPFDRISLAADGSVTAAAAPLALVAHPTTDAVVAAARSAPFERLRLEELDLVCLRTNPARHPGPPGAHALALSLLERIEAGGVRVRNAARGVRRAGSKLFLTALPASVRPPTAVTSDPDVVRALVRSAEGRAVLKPLEGTRGEGVIALDAPSLDARWPEVEAQLAEGPLVVQPFLAGADDGDVRVLVLDGEPLVVDGAVAAIGRTPAPGDFRGNLHAGATARPAALTPDMREALRRVAPALRVEGLAFVGVDFVGDQIIELNVASPGGLRDAERFAGRDFAGAVFARFTA